MGLPCAFSTAGRPVCTVHKKLSHTWSSRGSQSQSTIGRVLPSPVTSVCAGGVSSKRRPSVSRKMPTLARQRSTR